MWIFPQSKTAQFLFSSKDTRRVRHGRASTTEGFAKVLNASVGGNLVINRQDLFFFYRLPDTSWTLKVLTLTLLYIYYWTLLLVSIFLTLQSFCSC